MKGILCVTLSTLFGLAVSLPAGASGQSPHWSYEGNTGPVHWGALSPDYSLCETGKNQSPVNIQGALKTHHDAPELNFTTGRQDIVNTGHSLQVNVAEENTLRLDNDIWTLRQLHFHSPGENEIEGKQFPLEAHFVYQDRKGALAVLALMFAKGNVNPQLARLWQQMPAGVGQPTGLSVPLDLRAMLPQQLDYFRFSGSLTTPPCSEGVIWMVLEHPAPVSAEQISQFHSVIHYANNRPVQPLNGRIIVN